MHECAALLLIRFPMDIPSLAEDHRALGVAYCTGYADKKGKWRPGFYCPNTSESPERNAFCCGDRSHKFCCNESPFARQDEPSSSFMSTGNLVTVTMVTFLVTTLVTLASIVCCRKAWKTRQRRTSQVTRHRVSCSTSISGLAANALMPVDAASLALVQNSTTTAETHVLGGFPERYVHFPGLRPPALVATGPWTRAAAAALEAQVSFVEAPPSYRVSEVLKTRRASGAGNENGSAMAMTQLLQVLATPRRKDIVHPAGHVPLKRTLSQ